ncbi:hypothetical protein HDZ31DRAFT_36748 [Schizophyllum fasciatum]
MPPRPRPKPRPRPAPAAATSSAPSKPQDEDEFFIKHRSNEVWTQLNKLSEKDEKENQSRDSSDEESEGEGSPRKRKKRAKAPDGEYARPKWERDKAALRILSQGLDSDGDSSDSGIEIVGEGGPSTQGKRKRQESRPRSRSKSLTPPPMLSRERLEAARRVIKQTFEAHRRPTSTSPDDDEDEADLTNDTIVLDPDLERATKAAQSRASRASSATPFDNPDDKVNITVTWQPHPNDPHGKSEVFNFEVERHKPLRDVFESVADEMDVLSSRLYMTHRGVRIFGSVTANYLKVGKAASLVACDKATYDYLRELEEAQRRSSVHPPSDHEDAEDADDDDVVVIASDDEPSYPHTSTSTTASSSTTASTNRTSPSQPTTTHPTPTPRAPSEDADDGGGKFKIILRSGSFPDVPLTVRPTTTCGAIVRAFLKKVGLTDQFPNAGTAGAGAQAQPKGGRGRGAPPPAKDPHLVMDGDKLNHTAPIEEAELDDGDVLDVHGL